VVVPALIVALATETPLLLTLTPARRAIASSLHQTAPRHAQAEGSLSSSAPSSSRGFVVLAT
jgi:hypothetical protein